MLNPTKRKPWFVLDSKPYILLGMATMTVYWLWGWRWALAITSKSVVMRILYVDLRCAMKMKRKGKSCKFIWKNVSSLFLMVLLLFPITIILFIILCNALFLPNANQHDLFEGEMYVLTLALWILLLLRDAIQGCRKMWTEIIHACQSK